jgi:hypothetical protein
MAKTTKPTTRPAADPTTAQAAKVANQQPEQPKSATAPKPDNRKDDLVEVVVTWPDGMPGPGGTTLMPGAVTKFPSAEATAHLIAGKVELPPKAKGK